MKAAPFGYVRPTALDDAIAELSGDDDAKVIAGGQSLTPVLAMRLARPTTLVDINIVEGLDELRSDGDRLRIGATVRQRRVEHDPLTESVPLLRLALPWVGHRELRSRGTVCGSLAHADPAAELPAVACCLGADVELAGPSGTRTVPAREFFSGAMTTATEPDEVLTAVTFPQAAPGDGFGFAEFARRHGDFALAGVVACVRHDGRATLTGFGISDTPVTRSVTDLLAAGVASANSGDLGTALTAPLAELAAEAVDTEGDPHGSQDYRRRLFTSLAARQLAKAHQQSRENA
jgi:2-furoyl-CoA dehydrogenase FAD binding subunit